MAEEKLTKNNDLLTYTGLFQFVHEVHNKAFDPIDKNAAKAIVDVSIIAFAQTRAFKNWSHLFLSFRMRVPGKRSLWCPSTYSCERWPTLRVPKIRLTGFDEPSASFIDHRPDISMSAKKGQVLAFDVYGTLLDTSAIAGALVEHRKLTPERASELSAIWRVYPSQSEYVETTRPRITLSCFRYTWRLNSMGEHALYRSWLRKQTALKGYTSNGTWSRTRVSCMLPQSKA